MTLALVERINLGSTALSERSGTSKWGHVALEDWNRRAATIALETFEPTL